MIRKIGLLMATGILVVCLAMGLYLGFNSDQNTQVESNSAWISGKVIPDESIGNDGDFYLNTDTYDIFLKTDGKWDAVGNIMGAQGPEGQKGDVGSYWHIGVDSPTAALGKDGDFYINKTDFEFLMKVNGTWESLGCIKGDTGATGAAGNNGEKGDKGDDGVTWLNGIVAPLDTLGKDGDFYLNTSTFAIYLKTNGVWGFLGHIATDFTIEVESIVVNGSKYTYRSMYFAGEDYIGDVSITVIYNNGTKAVKPVTKAMTDFRVYSLSDWTLGNYDKPFYEDITISYGGKSATFGVAFVRAEEFADIEIVALSRSEFAVGENISGISVGYRYYATIDLAEYSYTNYYRHNTYYTYANTIYNSQGLPITQLDSRGTHVCFVEINNELNHIYLVVGNSDETYERETYFNILEGSYLEKRNFLLDAFGVPRDSNENILAGIQYVYANLTDDLMLIAPPMPNSVNDLELFFAQLFEITFSQNERWVSRYLFTKIYLFDLGEGNYEICGITSDGLIECWTGDSYAEIFNWLDPNLSIEGDVITAKCEDTVLGALSIVTLRRI